MRVRGSFSPSGAFSIEQQPNAPGMVLVRFYENATEYTQEADSVMGREAETGWVYDEYTLELVETATLESDIENQYEVYLQQAKLQEIMRQSYDPVQNRLQQEQAEQVRADVDFIAAMTGVDLL